VQSCWLPRFGQRFQQYFLCYDDLDFSIDISRMKFPDDFFGKMQPLIEKASAAMRELEAGAIVGETRVDHQFALEK